MSLGLVPASGAGFFQLRRRGWHPGAGRSGGGGIRVRASAAGSFYEVLGIPEGGSTEEIKRAYKQMALKYHPDVSPPERVEAHSRRFMEVREAYETLSDPGRRAMYDRDLARGLHLVFNSRRRLNEELDEKSGWRNRWEDQLAGLHRRGMKNFSESEGNLSWGARMRSQRDDESVSE